MPTILVVDDSAVDRRLIGGLLEASGRFDVKYAKDGAKALTAIAESAPDLVVTDLQMPEKDGLQLTAEVRLHFPSVPVVLVTAHGSEALAVKALAGGASSYVPKDDLRNSLVGTVDNVLDLCRADRSYSRLIGCMKQNEYVFELDNDVELVEPLADLLQQVVAGMNLFDVTERMRLGMAVEQALFNALFHGNLEVDDDLRRELRAGPQRAARQDWYRERRTREEFRDRKIYFRAHLSVDEVRFEVRDEGPGFDTSRLDELSEPEAIHAHQGRGLILIHSFMDEVRFNERGNELAMVKRVAS